MPTSVEHLRFPLNVSVAGILADLNAFLIGAGAISLYNVEFERRDSSVYGESGITVTYRSPGPAQFLAYGWQTGNAVPADSQADAFFAANPTLRGVFVLDVSPQLRRSLYNDAIITVTSEAMWSDCGAENQRMRIVVPDANIAAGATGAASLVSETGTIAANKVQVKNIFDFPWNAGAPGWAVLDPITRVWQGFSTCC